METQESSAPPPAEGGKDDHEENGGAVSQDVTPRPVDENTVPERRPRAATPIPTGPSLVGLPEASPSSSSTPLVPSQLVNQGVNVETSTGECSFFMLPSKVFWGSFY